MCGIIGYIGNKSIDQVLLAALSRLEYRGYDSAGMATVENGQISILRQAGKLKALKELVQKSPISGQMGIGHTRWATHGVPAERNAHPHTDCTKQIAVVHNGIIENYETLRKRLIFEGHQFNSETDTEVLAHLFESFHINQGKPLEEAARLVLHEIEGNYAFCVISSKNPEYFVAARNGSPLVIGVGKEENFVASDATAFIDYTREAVFLEDHQMAIVGRGKAAVQTSDGKKAVNKSVKIDWEAKDAAKEGYEHFMLKEIEEQPQVLDKMFRSRIKGDKIEIFDQLSFDKKEFADVKKILIQACGTSWHAALTGKFLLEGISGIPVEVDVSSEFRYRKLVKQPGTLALSITQSGETLDTLMGLRKAKEMGYKALSICNVLGSTIARESEGVIYTHAGPEIGVASTKAYTAQLAVLMLLAVELGIIRGTLKPAEAKHLLNELKIMPEKIQAIITKKDTVKIVAEKFYESRDFLFLGRGINYPNAHEGALKIKEIAYIHATGHPAGEMKHGPIALIDEKLPVVAIATKSALHEKMVSNIQEVKARCGKVISILTEGDEAIQKLSDYVIAVPETEEWFSPLLVALPLQYLAYYVATLRGTDVDQPRNLAKSVTVE